jgi:hypothetical protein
MKSWGIGALVVALAAPAAFAENAQQKEGTSGSSAATGSSHTSGGGGAAYGGSSTYSGSGGYTGTGSYSYGSSGGATSSGSTRDHDSGRSNDSSTRTPSESQRRHPRAGTGTGDRDGSGHHHGGYYGGGYYYPYYPYSYYPYPNDYYYGDYYYSRYPRYRYRHYDDSPAVRVLVKPDTARVYVDGYYAGTVDDFDGLFQRLYVPRGRHEVTLKAEGYRTHRFLIYAVPSRTIKLHYTMLKGEGEDEAEDLAGKIDTRDLDIDDDRDRDRDDRNTRYDDEDEDIRMGSRDSGTLSLDVHPRDASVYIDGELYRLATRNDVRVAEGTHRLEVVRPGYRTFERDVEVRRGKRTDLTIDLEKTEKLGKAKDKE